MINSEPIEDQLEKLPPNLGENEEYIRRIVVLDDFVVIEYSKKPMFIKHFHPSKVSGKDIDENLLFEVTAKTVEEAVKKMDQKVKNFKS
jgi:hypothetical protein